MFFEKSEKKYMRRVDQIVQLQWIEREREIAYIQKRVMWRGWLFWPKKLAENLA